MHGEKIQLCKETIELLSKYLLPKDKLSITTFDTDVKQIFQLSEMTSQNKQNVEAVIKNVKAGSSTNLSGGLMDAIGVLKQSNVKQCSKSMYFIN
jgi:Ca-activated chloride channel family protein